MSKRNPFNPRRGEVWKVNLNSTSRSETKKILTAAVISSDSLGYLTTRLIVPIITWQDDFSGIIWIVPIKPGDSNGLTTISAANTAQTFSADVRCFVRQQGVLDAPLILDIVASMAAVIELE